MHDYIEYLTQISLRDISKKYPELIVQELKTWDLSSKRVKQVYKIASKFVEADLLDKNLQLPCADLKLCKCN